MHSIVQVVTQITVEVTPPLPPVEDDDEEEEEEEEEVKAGEEQVYVLDPGPGAMCIFPVFP